MTLERSGALGPVARNVRRVVLSTQDGPLRWVWRAAYGLVARAFLAYLTRGHRGAAGYLTGGMGDRDAVYGNSDVDAVVVLRGEASDGDLARVHRRWERLVERFPPARLMLDEPQVYSEALLRRATGSVVTYGLYPGGGAAEASAGRSCEGPVFRLLVRPGLHGPGSRWRRIAGPERRPEPKVPDRQEQRIAAWLELQRWWREAFSLCAKPDHPLAADICVKLVAEPARVWLWLEHGERPEGRDAVLFRTVELLPVAAPALRTIAEIRRRLADSPVVPLPEVLRTQLFLTAQIAETIRRETADAAVVNVQLDGADDRLLLAKGGLGSHPDSDPADAAAAGPAPSLLPLCDWREVVAPDVPDAAVARVASDPDDPAAVGALARLAIRGAFPALRHGALIVMPSVLWSRGALRAVSCPTTDPVTFALLAGKSVAGFPELRGWAAGDWARRGCAEHAARRRQRSGEHGGVVLGRAITAARAALFSDSVEAGNPRLALTTAATLRALADRDVPDGLLEEVGQAYERFAAHWVEPPETVVRAFEETAASLPAYQR